MIKVLQPGFFTTVQDLGRFNFQDFGVPISGSMDAYSAKIANALVRNYENAAVIEITMTGPKLEFLTNGLVAITGANITPKLNDEEIPMNSAIFIKEGSVLTFGKLVYGFRAYLSVANGFQTEEVFGSKSMYNNITKEIALKKGMLLKIQPLKLNMKKANASLRIKKSHFNSEMIEVYEGPEFDKLSNDIVSKLFTQKFTIAKENSRMAYQLEEPLYNDLDAIITSLVLPGTVQLIPSGKLIILMRDCQTTGGYPRVLQLSESAINKLAQKMTGQTIQFQLLT